MVETKTTRYASYKVMDQTKIHDEFCEWAKTARIFETKTTLVKCRRVEIDLDDSMSSEEVDQKLLDVVVQHILVGVCVQRVGVEEVQLQLDLADALCLILIRLSKCGIEQLIPAGNQFGRRIAAVVEQIR